jgi:hypothetical protein
MDDERFQQMEKRLNKQAEATRAMNETLNEFMTIVSNIEAAEIITPPSPCLTTPCNHRSAGVATLQSQTGHPQ